MNFSMRYQSQASKLELVENSIKTMQLIVYMIVNLGAKLETSIGMSQKDSSAARVVNF